MRVMSVAFKSSYLYELFPVLTTLSRTGSMLAHTLDEVSSGLARMVLTKMAILSWRRIPLAILLYEQFIQNVHLTQFTLRPNKQFWALGGMLISHF